MKKKTFSKKKLNKLLKEFGYLIGIISEGFGSEHDCFVKTDIKINFYPNKRK